MSPAGLGIMIASVGAVTLLFGWCIAKVLRTPEETEKVHGFEGHTPDQDGNPD